jgi:diphthamide synthase (EF-2-diphthine--ammonia ligase)
MPQQIEANENGYEEIQIQELKQLRSQYSLRRKTCPEIVNLGAVVSTYHATEG